MARVKAKTFGYYRDMKRREGDIFIMKNVDNEGFYIDDAGKRIADLDKDGKPVLKDGKEIHRKCDWVTLDLNEKTASQQDPQAIARVISGIDAGLDQYDDFGSLTSGEPLDAGNKKPRKQA